MKKNGSFFAFLPFVLASVLVFSACKKNEETPQPTINSQKIENLSAPSDVIDRNTGQVTEVKPFVKFSIAEGKEVTGDNWDIAFKGTTIIINGGSTTQDNVIRTGVASAYIHTGIFEELTELNNDNWTQDNNIAYAIPKGSGKGWYNYNAQKNIISPIAGKIIALKTADNKYAKIEVLSYYKDAPASPTATSVSAYYTFRYVFQSNGTRKF